MSKKGLKENQIFAARDTVEENDKIKAALDAYYEQYGAVRD